MHHSRHPQNSMSTNFSDFPLWSTTRSRGINCTAVGYRQSNSSNYDYEALVVCPWLINRYIMVNDGQEYSIILIE